MSGSQVPEDPVLVGRVVRPRGIAGEVIVEPATENPARFEPGAELWLGDKPLTVLHARLDGERWVVRFEGIGGRDEAEALRGTELLVDSAALPPLEEDRYYVHDLIGCDLESPEGERLGTVTAVVPGVRDWLEVNSGGRRALVPMARAFLRTVDIAGRRIVVDTPDGLIEATATKNDSKR